MIAIWLALSVAAWVHSQTTGNPFSLHVAIALIGAFMVFISASEFLEKAVA